MSSMVNPVPANTGSLLSFGAFILTKAIVVHKMKDSVYKQHQQQWTNGRFLEIPKY